MISDAELAQIERRIALVGNHNSSSVIALSDGLALIGEVRRLRTALAASNRAACDAIEMRNAYSKQFSHHSMAGRTVEAVTAFEASWVALVELCPDLIPLGQIAQIGEGTD